MDSGWVMMLFIGGFILLIGIVGRQKSRKRGWNHAHRTLARKYGGHSFHGGIFGTPSTRFQYGDTYCTVSHFKKRGMHLTQFAIQWNDPLLKLEIFPSWRASTLWPFSGLHEVKDAGTGDFSTRYYVRSNQDEAARSFCTSGVCWQIDRLRMFQQKDDIYVSIHRGLLTIKKPGYIKNATSLDDLVRYCLETNDQAMLTRSIGISFVEDVGARVLEEVVCQICGEAIRVDMVFCVRCKTPHCQECWEYYGQCATFACGETRYLAPQIASEVVPPAQNDPGIQPENTTETSL